MRKRLVEYLLLISLVSSAFAQINQDLSIIGTPFNAVIPQDTKNLMSDGLEVERTIKFYEVVYNDSIVDVRFLKSSEPQANNLKFTIIPPDLGDYSKVSALVGFIYDGKKLIKTVLWIKTEDIEGRKKFFTDYNEDRDYMNDVGIIKVKNITTSIDVPFLLMGEKDYIRIGVQKTKRKKYVFQRFRNQPVIDMGLGASSGELTYSFDQYGYLANVTTKSLGVAASYYLGPIVIGVRSTIFNSNFYATYEYINGARTTGVNKDKHPLNKMQLGASIGVRVPLTKTIEIQPVGAYGSTFYFDPKYYPNYRFNQDEYFEHDKNDFFELGLRMNFIVGNQRAIYLIGMRNLQDWQPEGLGNGSEVQSELKMTRFEVGYSIGL